LDSDEESVTARLEQLYGKSAARKLRESRVGIIGCSGTGSPAIECLARAGVGEFVIVDYQRFGRSNLERIHGSRFAHTQRNPLPYKVELMAEMIGKSIQRHGSWHSLEISLMMKFLANFCVVICCLVAPTRIMGAQLLATLPHVSCASN